MCFGCALTQWCGASPVRNPDGSFSQTEELWDNGYKRADRICKGTSTAPCVIRTDRTFTFDSIGEVPYRCVDRATFQQELEKFICGPPRRLVFSYSSVCQADFEKTTARGSDNDTCSRLNNTPRVSVRP